MRIPWISLLVAAMLVGCGSGGGQGDEDAEDTVEESGDTTQDTNGEDTGVPDGVECERDEDCDDGDVCTTDTCDTTIGTCEHGDVDADGDGYLAEEVAGTACGGTDCDDADRDIHPDAPVGCGEGDDLDCDGLPDVDEDDDGFVTSECPAGDDCDDSDPDAFPGSTAIECSTSDRDCNGLPDEDNDGDGQDRVECGGSDCDDEDGTVYWGAVEAECDGKDTNCDGEMSGTEDFDGDGYANSGCLAAGALEDCDDSQAATYPGATELCDSVDQDCDGSWADGGADDDLDGYLDEACGGDDCDDARDDINPAAVEVCDTVDDDCDGSWADGGADDDADGRLDETCSGDDCDDTRGDTYTGATEICDTVDQDCDGSLLDATGADDDLDGYLDGSCGGNDCDDARDDVHPGAVEACDTVDDDCDGSWADGGADDDADGHLDGTCGGDDCDDTRGDTFTGATEICDSVDQDCDGSWTDGGADDDLDGHLDATCGGDDCDDGRADAYFGALEICLDARDNDCDGLTDETSRALPDLRLSSTNSSDPAVAWTGSEFGVCWQYDTGGYVGFARISPAGSMIGSSVTFGGLGTPSTPEPSIAWSGSEFGVTWSHASSLYFQRLSAGGALVGSWIRVSLGVNTTRSNTMTWSGSEFGLAWERISSTWDEEVLFARVAADGTVLASDVRLNDGSGNAFDPSIAWAGSRYGVAWEDSRDGNGEIYMDLVSGDGTEIGADRRITTTSGRTERSPSLAWTGSEFGVAYPSDSDLYLARIDVNGAKIGSEMLVSDSAEPSQAPSLVWAGSVYGLAWVFNPTLTNRQVYFVLLSDTGTVLGSRERLTYLTSQSYYPSLAWTGSEYGVSWSSISSVYFNVIRYCGP